MLETNWTFDQTPLSTFPQNTFGNLQYTKVTRAGLKTVILPGVHIIYTPQFVLLPLTWWSAVTRGQVLLCISGYRYNRHLGQVAQVLGSTVCEVALGSSDRSKDSSVVCLYYLHVHRQQEIWLCVYNVLKSSCLSKTSGSVLWDQLISSYCAFIHDSSSKLFLSLYTSYSQTVETYMVGCMHACCDLVMHWWSLSR